MPAVIVVVVPPDAPDAVIIADDAVVVGVDWDCGQAEEADALANDWFKFMTESISLRRWDRDGSVE